LFETNQELKDVVEMLRKKGSTDEDVISFIKRAEDCQRKSNGTIALIKALRETKPV